MRVPGWGGYLRRTTVPVITANQLPRCNYCRWRFRCSVLKRAAWYSSYCKGFANVLDWRGSNRPGATRAPAQYLHKNTTQKQPISYTEYTGTKTSFLFCFRCMWVVLSPTCFRTVRTLSCRNRNRRSSPSFFPRPTLPWLVHSISCLYAYDFIIQERRTSPQRRYPASWLGCDVGWRRQDV